MQKQLTHYEFKNSQVKNKNNIIFVLDNLENEENIGSIFRIADAFNIDRIIIICNKELVIKKIKKTARSCEKVVAFSVFDNAEAALSEVEKANYTPVNIEITSTSRPLRKLNFADLKNVALIVGNEKHGISDYILNHVPLSCHIEMYGNNSSMNVATSLAIAAYKASEDFLLNKPLY